MTNEEEIEKIAKFIVTEQPISWRFKFSRNIDDVYNDTDVEIMSKYTAENFVNAGIGDKKKAVKEFMERILSECENNAVYAEWRDKHGEYGGDMVAIGAIETMLDKLFTELYGANK